MILNYKNSAITFDFPKIIITNNYWDIAKLIVKQNSKAILITPFSKVKDLFEIKNGSPLFNLINSFLDKDFIDEQKLYELENQLNNEIGDIFEIGPNLFKTIKALVEIKDEYVSSKTFASLIKLLIKDAKEKEIIVLGFETQFQNLLKTFPEISNIVWLSNELPKFNIVNEQIELVVFETEQSLLEILDYSVLKIFLEQNCLESLSDQQINDYLNQSTFDYSSFLIEKTLKKL